MDTEHAEAGTPEETKCAEKSEGNIPCSFVVGLGASAGGLEALVEFFSHAPPDTGMSFVVVQHLSPDYKSLMDELLARHTEMEIIKVSDGISLQSNRIYLLPPKKNLTIFNRQLLLSDSASHTGLNLPIDFFFRSLAEDQEDRAIGIILSGTGSDGTRGIQAIKKAGGMTLVQDEQSAKFDGMPRSAVATGLVDYIIRPAEMPKAMLAYARHPVISGVEDRSRIFSHYETDLTKLIAMLRSRTKVDFSFYKTATIQRRIERRMGITGTANLGEYLQYTKDYPEEVDALYRDLLIGVTRFYRDKDEFNYLREKIIPVIFENCRKDKMIRAWVVGCSSGEEAFTIAILLYDYMVSQKKYYEIKVFATDIDKDAIIRAGQGIYPDGIAGDLDAVLLEKYFDKISEGFRVKRHIRELVIFARQNILRDPPFTKIDLITCRNLLIYLQSNLQKDVMGLFHFALKDRGYLFLGTSETVGDAADYFVPADRTVKVFLHKGRGIPPVRRIPHPAISPKNRYVPAGSSPHSPCDSPGKIIERLENYYQEIINHLIPACAVVSEKGMLSETFGNPDHFLKTHPGKADLNISRMVPPNMALAISTGIRNAVKDRKKIAFPDIRSEFPEGQRHVRMKIIPLKPRTEMQKLLITFEEVYAETAGNETAYCLEERSDQHILDLQNEIQLTKESLQAANEELQSSNEELQATNEELLASNEELQSTNEELNSVNEELNTVNAEYQSKIQELIELNTDMDNLFHSTDIGIIFLDNKLRIRKFTPAVTQEINLLQQDIGRPFSDLSIPMLSDVQHIIRDALIHGEKSEQTILSPNKQWYLLRVHPYTDEQAKFRGVVISIVNITKQKQAEIALERQVEVLKQVLETSPAAQLMTDREGKIIFFNLPAAELLADSLGQIKDKSFDSQGLGICDLDGNPISIRQGPLAKILEKKEKVGNYVMKLQKPDRQEVILSVSGNPIFNEKGDVDRAVFKLEKLAHKTIEREDG
ncbi:MAG: chemotaxis protein CheB [Desulfococcaceae bacterium]|jgi:two-component system CheB/CheR fusion protein|nr:chemotaxis protein CheB [Desulfococcaceae bacterium]